MADLRFKWLVMLAAVMLLAACGAPAIQPLHLGDAPWQAGEIAAYTLVDGGGNTVGAATLAASAAPVNGAPGWLLQRAVTGSAGREMSSVSAGADGYRPAQSVYALTAADGTEQVNATYNQGEVNLELTTKLNNTTYQRFSVPTDARDQRSLPWLARTLPLAQGYAAQINTFLPLTGRLERVTISVGKQAEISVPAGTFTTWPVTLDNGERKVQIWLDINAAHTLVQMKEGDVTWQLMPTPNPA